MSVQKMTKCPVCHGAGRTSAWKSCKRCNGTGEVNALSRKRERAHLRNATAAGQEPAA